MVRDKVLDETGRDRGAFLRPQRRRQPRLRFSGRRRLADDGARQSVFMHRFLGSTTPLPEHATRSKNRSSGSSMPTDSRSRSSGHGVPAPSIEARCSIRLSTPPSEVARFQTLTFAAACTAAAWPPLSADRQHAAKSAGHLPHRDVVAGMVFEARIENVATAPDDPTSRLRAARRVLHCSRTRRSSVLIPRISSQASNGPRVAPIWARAPAECGSTASLVPATASAPATTSECPLRYFVAECTTMSAPCAIGRVRIGVETVESTQSSAPAACAISETAAMSVIVHSGLLGVSIQTMPVLPGWTASRTACRSDVSTKVTEWP